MLWIILYGTLSDVIHFHQLTKLGLTLILCYKIVQFSRKDTKSVNLLIWSSQHTTWTGPWGGQQGLTLPMSTSTCHPASMLCWAASSWDNPVNAPNASKLIDEYAVATKWAAFWRTFSENKWKQMIACVISYFVWAKR